MAGVSTRQLQRMAAAGEVPGAVRSPAGHWRIPDDAGVRRWCAAMKKFRQSQRKRAACKPPMRRAPYGRLEATLVVAERVLYHGAASGDPLAAEVARQRVAEVGRQLIAMAR